MKTLENIGKNPFFSIVIATFNNRKSLEVCLKSIEIQRFTDYEILISDGGSTDGIAEMLYSNTIPNLSWFKSEPDNGIYSALNTAFSKIKGKWVIVIGGDDRFIDADSLLQAHNKIALSTKNSGIFYSNIIIDDGNSLRLKKYPEFQEFSRKYHGAPVIHHQSAFVNSLYLNSASSFNEKYLIHADYDLLLSILSKSSVQKIDGVFIVYSSLGYSSKLTNIYRSFREMFVIRANHHYFPLPLAMVITYGWLLINRFFTLCCTQINKCTNNLIKKRVDQK